MGMEINGVGNAAGIYHNHLTGTKDIGKTEETKGTNSQEPKTAEQSVTMTPRYDTVEISAAGKEANSLIQAQKDVIGVVQQSEAKKTGGINIVDQEVYGKKETDTDKVIRSNGIENQEDSMEQESQSDVENQKIAGNTAHPAKSEKLSSDKDNEDPTEDLSSLTDTELKQIYLKGDITKTEYDDELADRGIVESE